MMTLPNLSAASNSSDLSTLDNAGTSRVSRTVVIAGASLAGIAIIGVILVFMFVSDQRERDLQAWQTRMGIIADSRFAAINGWIEAQFGTMRGLAENVSLQLYLTELNMFAGDASQVMDEPAQRTYLRNLLVSTADRGGFTAPLLGAEINANVERIGVAGIAIVDNDAEVIVATPGMPPVEGDLASIILESRGKRALYDMYIGPGGRATMGFLAPIFALQSDGSPSSQIGVVIGVKEIGDELYPLLEQPGAVSTSAEAVLLRGAGASIDYLSPLMDGSAPLSRALARDTPNLAAAFAIELPGGFAVRRDYQNIEVLTLGRAFTAAPWTLMYKIDAAEALADTNNRLGVMLTVFLLIIVAVAVALIAAWRHGTSLRSSQAATRASELARKFGQQRDFLELVTDSQRSAMAIIDGDGHYIWVNRQSAENNGMIAADVPGKALDAVVGAANAKPVLRNIRDVLDSGVSEVVTHSDKSDTETRTFTSEFIPLEATDELPERVLVVTEDVSIVLREQLKRERIMGQLVHTLVGVVDRRDPNSANHSAWVAVVARAIADDMELDDIEANCVEITGRVMSLGKITVPEHILTKTEALTDEEFKLVRGAIGVSAELLEGVEFDGPVVATLRELHDHAGDGVFKADGLLLTTRIVAVANVFVALTSPRAYRPGMTFDEALDTLLQHRDCSDTRRAVLSLAHFLDIHGGREKLSGIGKSPPPAS